jgi:hypothetical protein
MFKSFEIKPIHFISVILILIILMMGQCSRMSTLKAQRDANEDKVTRIENNLAAANDSIKSYKSKNNYFVSQISGFEKTVEELRNEKDQTYKKYVEALDLNKKLKNVNSLLLIEIQNRDSIINAMASVTYDGEITRISFRDDKDFGGNNWRKFNGEVSLKLDGQKIVPTGSKFDYTQNITLYSALETIDGKKRVKISTKYPGINFNTIENISVIEDELNRVRQEKTWRMGISGGVMYGATVLNGQLYLLPMVGIGFTITPKWLSF